MKPSTVYLLVTCLFIMVVSLGDIASCRNPNDYLAIADHTPVNATPDTPPPSEPASDQAVPDNATASVDVVRVAVPVSCGPRGCTYRYEYRAVNRSASSGPYVDPNANPNPSPDAISTPVVQASSTGPVRNFFSRVRSRVRGAIFGVASRLRGFRCR